MRVARTLLRWQRTVLQRLYGFDTWHVGHANETYVADIVRHLNHRPAEARGRVVEIGCGTGDILRRLRYEHRLGLDRDAGVLAAARLLALAQFSARPRFEHFEFPIDTLAGVYDAIIMVNWTHLVPPEQLRPVLQQYAAKHLRPEGVIVLDTVKDPAYTYAHDVHAFGLPRIKIDRLGEYPRGRQVWVLHAMA
jgi:SAM-dependent methyltransferase